MGERPFIAIDTGGLEPGAKTGIFAEMARQAEQAIAEADAVIFMTDGRGGLHDDDRVIAGRLRKLGVRVWLAVNKCEGMASDTAVAEFHALGLGAAAADLRGARRRCRRPAGGRAGGVPGAGRRRARSQGKAAARGDRRPAQRRQVDAGERAGRRGARDRLRRARHDARRDRGAVRARRAALHADRHRRPAQARQAGRSGGALLHRQDAAGDRAGQRRGAGAGRGRGHLRAGRARRRLHPGARPRAGGGGEQVGRRRPRRRASASSASSRGSWASSASPRRTTSRRRPARAWAS